ncbi:unnamed protein product [Durusdinium trenchii]|uniref:Uncharacterized protein n=1 Tax=Durusdinium trenchii TaxID=1381693 RepID=A0ABP0KRQ1_9DINO
MAHMQLRTVRQLVGRFYIAHWTALYYIHGLRPSPRQGPGSSPVGSSRLARAFSSEVGGILSNRPRAEQMERMTRLDATPTLPAPCAAPRCRARRAASAGLASDWTD